MKAIFTFLYFILLCNVLTDAGSSDALNFLVLGDWGGIPFFPYASPFEWAVAKQMGRTADKTNSKFVVALGDNFYYDGVKNEYDKRFQETYEKIYTADSLQIPWYVIAGNHDHRGNISGQIAYSAHSKRWKYPSLWYSKKWIVPNSTVNIQLIMVDTILLCGNTGHDDEKLQPQGPENYEVAESQWSWLEEQLKYSRDQYLLVGGHFPVWSVAEHGPTDCLVERLKPLLEKYKVNAYLCGHDHNLQHIHEENNDVHYFVVGAGDVTYYDMQHSSSVPDRSLRFFWGNTFKLGGFAHVNVTKEKMTLSMIDAFGEILYKQDILPRML